MWLSIPRLLLCGVGVLSRVACLAWLTVIPLMALRVRGIVSAELAALLTVLEAALGGGPVGVLSLRRPVAGWGVAVLGCLGGIALLGIALRVGVIGLGWVAAVGLVGVGVLVVGV